MGFGIVISAIPISIGIAVLRRQPWDINWMQPDHVPLWLHESPRNGWQPCAHEIS
jgi:hypothetical protein